MRRNPNLMKNGCPHSSASKIRQKIDARVRQHPKSDEKRMPTFASIRNQAKNGCPHSPASEIRRKTDARIRQHPKIGLRTDARVCQHPKSDEKRMPTFASIRNSAKNGCSRLPASEIGQKKDARICQHPFVALF